MKDQFTPNNIEEYFETEHGNRSHSIGLVSCVLLNVAGNTASCYWYLILNKPGGFFCPQYHPGVDSKGPTGRHGSSPDNLDGQQAREQPEDYSWSWYHESGREKNGWVDLVHHVSVLQNDSFYKLSSLLAPANLFVLWRVRDWMDVVFANIESATWRIRIKRNDFSL